MSRHLSIDIETYSSVDITKSGLYKYVQSDDFEILLFAYSVDGGDVTIIDLACGESLPEEIVQAVFDPNVQNHAYNAAFEWYCLSKYFQIEPLSWLSQWRCTQLHGLYCGYTAGLAATGEALGLPQEKRKLATGKALIRTFCTPHTPNARNPTTRVLPRHEPEKWRLFREYCKQDVVTEMAIERRLSAFPVPEQVQREWELDQRINAAGIRLDMDLIDGALHIAGAVTSDLMQEAVTLTGLENPNAVGQLKGWVETQTGLTVESLDKETVKELLARSELPSKVRRVLEIRQELGEVLGKEVRGNGEKRLQRRACSGTAAILRGEPYRTLGRAAGAGTESAPQLHRGTGPCQRYGKGKGHGNDRSDLRQCAGHAVPADPDGFRSGKGLQICCGGFFSDRSPCDRMACKGNMAAGGVPHTWKDLRSFGIGNVWCTY